MQIYDSVNEKFIDESEKDPSDPFGRYRYVSRNELLDGLYTSYIKGIEESALAAGLRGDEVTMHIADVLEKNGRYDLLPPCYCKGENE